MKFLILSTLLLFTLVKGDTSLPSQATCGNWDNEEHAPAFIFAIERKGALTNCVGMLITKRFLLTTPDCVKKIDEVEEMTIGRCIRDTATPKECIFKPEKLIEHKEQGVVLVKLDRDVPVPRRTPICLDQWSFNTQNVELHNLHDKERGKWTFDTDEVRMVDKKQCRDLKQDLDEDILCIETNNCRSLEPIIQNTILMKNRNGKYILGGVMREGSCLDDKHVYVKDVQRLKDWIKQQINEN